MIPRDDFTPHGYLDNPYHSWKLNPCGVLRSCEPLGMGWHVPNLGSYGYNQFQYTAHLALGLRVGDVTLVTPDDFKQHGCTITSSLHTKNRFEYTCTLPLLNITLTARYFLVYEHALGCVLSLTTTSNEAVPVTCYLMHLHTHNPYTSRLWEHGLYLHDGPQAGSVMLGLASEGDVFVHGVRAADGTPLAFGEAGYVTSLTEAASWVHGESVPHPSITQRQEDTGWQRRVVVLPCSLTIEAAGTHTLNVVLARGVSQDTACVHWDDALEEIARIEAEHHADDEQFWQRAPQLTGDWPASWRRGWVYDLETLRMTIRPSAGVLPYAWDGMQIQAPRTVLAEAAMDVLFLSYADPVLAAEVIVGHFESSPHLNVPCMREDGSYNMVADDGQICGTAPEWGFPVWCCDQLFKRSGDLQWLRRLYPRVAAYLHWWLEHRRDAEGWLVYACSWESGQDVSSRFGPQQTGGTIIQHVRPVDLQASMAQAADTLARWATLLAQDNVPDGEGDFAAEATQWRTLAHEFTIKTRLMWQQGWFRDYDSVAQEWSSQQDAMHLAPVFCGAAGWGHTEQLRPYLAQPPMHSSGWAPLSWPPVVMTLIGAAAAAHLPADAAELSYRFIDASYRSMDAREPDEQGGLPGVTREYRRTLPSNDGQGVDYASAGIEGYGWGALSIHLLLRYLLGLREEEANTITVAPCLPLVLRRSQATYRVQPVQWGKYTLAVECVVRDADGYSLRLRCSTRVDEDMLGSEEIIERTPTIVYTYEHEGTWGEQQTLHLPQLTVKKP